MIYIHRDWTNIPQEKLDALKEISGQLEAIADVEVRKIFIKENSEKWSSVRKELSNMSFDKCWYTEAREGVSRYQTDHFRPHGRAKQAEKSYYAGYCWLAFDIDNFRIVGVLANAANQEFSEETVGKADWFPLLDPNSRATLADRSIDIETPLLLDPVNLDDVGKIEFNDNGEAHPSNKVSEGEKVYVDSAISVMGIRQDRLNRLRREKWRECTRKILMYNRFFAKPKGQRTLQETITMRELAEEIVTMSSCKSEFSSTVRCCLKSNRLESFVIRDELKPLVLEQ